MNEQLTKREQIALAVLLEYLRADMGKEVILPINVTPPDSHSYYADSAVRQTDALLERLKK